MNEDFSQRLLERIEHEHIKPISRWVVFARRGLIWTVLLLSIGCAALLGSLLIMATLKVDLEFLRVSSFGPMLRLLLDYVPILWVILFFAFCVLEIYLIRRETHAYRYSSFMVAGFVLFGASFIGLGLYATSLPERVEQTVQQRLPPPHWMMRRESQPRPEDGILFGRVVMVSSTTFSLEGPQHDVWEVRVSQTASGTSLVEIDRFILVEGQMMERNLFSASAIHPYRGPKPGGRVPQRDVLKPGPPQEKLRR